MNWHVKLSEMASALEKLKMLKVKQEVYEGFYDRFKALKQEALHSMEEKNSKNTKTTVSVEFDKLSRDISEQVTELEDTMVTLTNPSLPRYEYK